ncbi:MAG: hypothetical protein F4190_07135 [Acidimicrobiales bacterium]|nr:hypothetical protein [Acidimicrobiales bacterium]MYG88288.1 hypothetical protein [Acidimicrobiales bacterium]MYI29690.1 hypothetical protein [Acidimicrobiales bacterium]
MTDDQDAAGLRPVPADKRRPRPALPPGVERSQWSRRPLEPGELRRIPDLIRDSLSLIGRRWRPFGEFVLIGVAGYLVAFVMLFLGLNALFNGQFFSKISELTDPTGGTVVDYEAWLESFDVTPTTTAIVLLFAFGFACCLGFLVQEIAVTRMAFDDVRGRPINFGETLMAAIRRMPKIFGLSVLLGLVMALVGCGLSVLLLWAAPVLGVLWLLAYLVAFVVFFPLLVVYFVMAYVEPRIPSPRRWWRLIRGRKAAIWGRVMLLGFAANLVGFGLTAGLGALPLPALYGDLFINAMVFPLIFVLGAVFHLLIYVDLIAGEQSADPQVEVEPLG